MVVYADPKELPATLSIGTQKAFDEGYQYKYHFVEEIKPGQLPGLTVKSWLSQWAQMNMGILGMLLQKANYRSLAMARGSMADKWCSAHERNSGRLESMSGR